MSGIRLEVSDLARLSADLRSLSEGVQQQGASLLAQAADRAFAAIQRAFPAESDSGELRLGTSLTVVSELRAVIDNDVYYASFYELGFQHYTAGGAQRTHTKAKRYGGRGRAVAGHDLFIPAMQRARAAFIDDLRQLVDTARGVPLQVLEAGA